MTHEINSFTHSNHPEQSLQNLCGSARPFEVLTFVQPSAWPSVYSCKEPLKTWWCILAAKTNKRKDRFSTLAAPVIQLRECNPHRRKLPQRPSKTNCLVDNGQLWPSIIACVETCLREFTPERFGERKQANTRSFGNNFSPTAIALGSSKGLRANSCFGVSWGKSLLGQMAFAQETVL